MYVLAVNMIELKKKILIQIYSDLRQYLHI